MTGSGAFLIRVELETWRVRAQGAVTKAGPLLLGLQGVARGGLAGLSAAHARHGDGFTPHLDGQYAAAIVDDRRRRVVLAQSVLGLGTLYWARRTGHLIVGTGLFDVAAAAGLTTPDADYFARYLTLKPAETLTPIAGVSMLHGGETRIVTAGGDRTLRPWVPRLGPASAAPDADLAQHLEAALDLLAPGEVPAVYEISGGTDSSLVAATARQTGRSFTSLTYDSRRHMLGGDGDYADLVAGRLGSPRIRVDPDRLGLTTRIETLPEHPVSCRYASTLADLATRLRDIGAARLVTGVGGDGVFDYRGLVPCFLADPLVRGNLPGAWRVARAYTAERGTDRRASHYMRHIALPVARAFRRQERLTTWLDLPVPPWVPDPVQARLAGASRSPALEVDRPSARGLWEIVFEMTAAENLEGDLFGPVLRVHPLLHRELVEMLINLDVTVRRGIPGDRAIQRRALHRLGLPEIATRQGKGSGAPLREVHVQEAQTFLEALRDDSRLVDLGWVDPEGWRAALDRASVGAEPAFAAFSVALEAELWLRGHAEGRGTPRLRLADPSRADPDTPVRATPTSVP